jgi:hypothetical protein
MLLRRMIEHVKAQNWTAIVIDFVIVVVGVFIGLQVSIWNEERQDDSRTQSYYKRLLDDLESERSALLARLDYLAVTVKYGRSALAAFSTPASMQSSKFLIDAYQASQIWTYSVQRATYDEILSSGIADAIPEPDLRTQLANIFLNAEAVRQVVVATTPYRQQIRLYMPYDIQAAIRENCSDQFIATEKNLLVLELPSTCSLEFTEDQLDTAIDALGEYEQFERELVQRLASIEVTRAAIEPHLLLIDSITEELRNRLQ